MGYKIDSILIRNIATPIICVLGDKRREFADGALLAETAWDRPYQVKQISVRDGKIEMILETAEKSVVEEPINWIGEEAVPGSPQYSESEQWVKEHREQFGEDPGFF